MSNIKEAIDTLVLALEEDGKEPGSYYYSWQANIAMCIYDEFQSRPFPIMLPEEYNMIFNKGAQRFLDMLISTTSYHRNNLS